MDKSLPARPRDVFREAFAFGLELRHKKGCNWSNPPSNFQKHKNCPCGRDELYSRLNKATFEEAV